LVTWEDLEALCQRFPLAPAWGQAGFVEGGGDYVSTTEEAGAGNQLAVQETSARLSRGQVGDTWPTRVKKLNLRYGGPEWVCE
jgi:hypothetical protein